VVTEEPEETVEEKAPETDLEETTEIEPPETAIRKAAQDAGINYWHNKSISRLTNELEELENVE